MREKVFLPVILAVAALLFCFPSHAQEQKAGCLVTAVVEETEGQEGDGEPSPSPLAMASPQTGKEDNDILTGPPKQNNGGLWVFLGVDLGSVCGWPMLLLFFLLLLLLLCLIARLA